MQNFLLLTVQYINNFRTRKFKNLDSQGQSASTWADIPKSYMPNLNTTLTVLEVINMINVIKHL